jgi:hypothetical protein
LHLDATQQNRLHELLTQSLRQWQESFLSMGRLPPVERERQAIEQGYAVERELKKLLADAQLIRLKQISLQADVAEAIREPEVEASLQLTEVQREQIRTISEQAFAGGMTRSPTDGKSEDKAAAQLRVKNEKNSRIVLLFTAVQLHKWRELTGPGIEAPIWSVSPQMPAWSAPKKAADAPSTTP